jgi:hypothetical protein
VAYDTVERARPAHSKATGTGAARTAPTTAPPTAPLWLRIGLTAIAVILVVYYWHLFGWRNYLWLSDVALFVTVLALWRTSPLLNSMMVIGILPFELYWNLVFLVRLTTGIEIGEITDYVLDPGLPVLLRALSLFHVALPVIWLTLLFRWGYDRRAFRWQTLLFWGVVAATYLATDARDNINWVFLPARLGLAWLGESAWLLVYMGLVPALIYWPLHRLLARTMARRQDRAIA